MKRLLSIFLLCAMLVSLLASCAPEQGLLGLDDYVNEIELEDTAYTDQAAWNGTAVDKSWYSDSANSFTLYDGADLKGLITLVSEGKTFAGKTVKLNNDINLGNKAWSIPTSEYYFQGIFDGNSKTIGGFTMTCTTGNQSLLGAIGGGATVKNLTVQRGTLTLKATAATSYAAIVISKIVTTSGKTVTVDNVDITKIKIGDNTYNCSIGYDSNSKSFARIGAIVGGVTGNGNVEIKNCSSTAPVVGREYVAGIVGEIVINNATATIQNCTNSGSVTLYEKSAGNYAAGIIACGAGDQSTYSISDCTNAGLIRYEGSSTDGGRWLGGIGGYIMGTNSGTKYLTSVTVTNCESTGAVYGNRTSGGLIGFVQRVESLSITGCTVNADLRFTLASTGNRSFGGLVGAIHMKNLSCPATVSDCTVTGSMRFEDPLHYLGNQYTAGGLIGIARAATLSVTGCEVSAKFANATEGDTYNVVTGQKENEAVVNVTDLTYIWHNDIPTLDSGIDLADVSYFKYVGQQTKDNEDGTQDLRFVFGIGNIQNSKDKAIGFDVAIKKLGLDVTETTKTVYCSKIYAGITGDGKTYKASDFGCNYLYTLVIKNIPTAEMDPDGDITYIKNAILNVTPFSQSVENGEKHSGFGLVDYVKKPDQHVFRFEDFSGARPSEFGTGNGIILNKNISSTFTGLTNTTVKTMKTGSQYIFQSKCTCTGNHCTCSWNANAAVAYDPYAATPYHYYIDIGSYEKAAYFGESLDRYEAYHTWSFTVPEDGLYEFCFRIRLSDGNNQNRYALVQLDGEAYGDQTEFTYTVNMIDELNGTIRDANHDSYLRGYKRYLSAGTHTITFRVPYNTQFVTDKATSMHFRDIYLAKTVADPVDADIPKLEGATLYDGNFDTSVTYVLDNTTESVLNSYIAQLEAAGFDLKGNKMTSYQYSSFDSDNYNRNRNTMKNKFYLYTNEDYMVYAYYTEGAKAIRVIVDYVEEFETYLDAHTDDYNAATDKVTTPMFAMLDIGGVDGIQQTKSDGTLITDGNGNPKTITGVTNGMCLVYRLSDGRFIVVDGGFWNVNDGVGAGVKRLYDWLQKNDHLAGENNNIVIANWIITHHHSDHISVAHKFESMYNGNGKVTIENFMYNFPSYEYAMSVYGTNLSVTEYRKYYPKLHNTMQSNNCLVAHTGMTYQFADCSIEILYTHEDFYPEQIVSYNNSSTVFKITLAGKTFLVAGDLEEPGQKRAIKQSGTLLESDFLQMTHHGYNGQIEFYKYIVGANNSTASGFNEDTIIVCPLPKGETDSMYTGTSAKATANSWLKDMFRKENDQANDNMHFAIENWVYTDFN